MAVLTLAELRQACRERADMENNSFISDDELIRLINSSITEFMDILISKDSAHYYLNSQDINTQSGVGDYNLPTDFYKLCGVDLYRSPDSPMALRPLMWHERNYNRYPGPRMPYDIRYVMIGNVIRFVPVPTGVYRITLHYIPLSILLTEDDDTFNGYNGWEEYVIVRAAIMMRVKEESDVTDLRQELFLLKERIEIMADNRDMGEVSTITDVNPIYNREIYNVWP